MGQPLLDTDEARLRLGVSRTTLERLVKDGLLPVIQTRPRARRLFRPEDLDALLTPKQSA